MGKQDTKKTLKGSANGNTIYSILISRKISIAIFNRKLLATGAKIVRTKQQPSSYREKAARFETSAEQDNSELAH